MADPVERYKEGLGHYGAGRWAEAIVAFDQGLAERPDWADLLQAKGMAEMHAGKLAEAVATLEKVTRLAPEDPSAFTSLSMAYVRQERIEDAEKAQETARMLVWKKETGGDPGA